jgi:DNA-binding transcriptional LysR family regulator
MSFSFRQLRYFVAVAKLGSISAAARELFTSQSTVTEAIKNLEADLGITLVQRRARGMELTHSGHKFLRHAQHILADVSYARSAFTTEYHRITGTLNVGVTSLVAGYALPELLARYRRAFPGTAVSVYEDSPEYLEHFLLNGELDVALLFLSAIQEPSAFNSQVLERYAFRVWLPFGHHLADAGPVRHTQLRDERYVLLDSDDIRTSTEALWRAIPTTPRIAYRTTSVEAVRSLVATGAGISILPDLIYRPWSLDGDRIGVAELDKPLPPVAVGVVSRRGTSLSAAATAFTEMALEKTSLHAG